MKTLVSRTLIVFTLISLCSIQSFAQCMGNVTLSTQTEVNNFSCNTFDGNLTIQDDNDGIDDIISIDPIAVNGFLQTVTGSLIISSCNQLNSLQGIDAVLNIGNDLIIQNNAILNNFGNYAFDLITIGGSLVFADNNSFEFFTAYNDITDIGGNLYIRNNALLQTFEFISLSTITEDFRIENNPQLITGFTPVTSIGSTVISNNQNLQNLNHLSNLQTIDGASPFLTIVDNPLLSDISGLDNLTFCSGTIDIRDTAIPTLDGMNNLTTLNGKFRLLANTSLVSIAGLNGITSVEAIEIVNNTQLNEITGFSSLLNITAGQLFIESSPLQNGISGLSNLETISDQIRINNCNGFSDISPLANLNAVSGDLIITGCPSLNDCCLLIDIEPAIFLGNIILSSNGSDCSDYNAIINSPPSFTDCTSGAISLDTDPGSCTYFGDFIFPTPIDNCGIDSYTAEITFPDGSSNTYNPVPGASNPLSLDVGITIFDYTAGDVNGNLTQCIVTVEVQDDQPPVFDNCPTDFTVLTDPGSCVATVTLDDPIVTDNCSLSSYIVDLTFPSGNQSNGNLASSGAPFTYFFDIGVTELIFIATDESGLVSSCQFSFTVQDNMENTYYEDVDGDGFGNPFSTIQTCDSSPPGYVIDNTDCDDHDPDNYPGNSEICDSQDNNCDGLVDAADPLFAGYTTNTCLGNSTLWNDYNNWSLGRVPNACDDVIIPNGLTAIIQNGEFGICHTIEVAAGGVFDVQNGADFEAFAD